MDGVSGYEYVFDRGEEDIELTVSIKKIESLN